MIAVGFDINCFNANPDGSSHTFGLIGLIACGRLFESKKTG